MSRNGHESLPRDDDEPDRLKHQNEMTSPAIRRLEAQIAALLPDLTDRQRAFVAYMRDDYSRRPFAVGAARAAGYAWPESQGPRLRTMPTVAAILRLHARIVARQEDLWYDYLTRQPR